MLVQMNIQNLSSNFCDAFRALNGASPFPWQEEAFRRLTNGELLGPVDVPTGLGKTAIITVWLLALAWHRLGRGAAVANRLVYVVNRRAVVDQATDTVGDLCEKLCEIDDPIIRDLCAALGLASGKDLLMSTLRGQKAENRDWLTDPVRPAIVVGTVDMIGSRLLFSAYRSNRWLRPLYAGLIGQDAMVIHDEAHLEPAFDALVRSVAAMQQETGGGVLGKPLRVLSLSATQRGEDTQTPPLFDVNAHLAGEAKQRLEAKRTLNLREVKPADLAEEMAAHALSLGDAAGVRGVIVFANRPDTALTVAAKLRASVGDARVAVLTGRMRGFERDLLVKSPVFRALQAQEQNPLPDGTAYLVATSAGEVGIDLDATHLVTELAPLDAMAQRFGRANRRGTGAATLAVLWSTAHTEPKTPLGEQRARTLDLLTGIVEDGGGDASPLRMAPRLKTAEARLAMTPAPAILPLTPPLVESWSQTSLPDRDRPDRPEIAPWLHGLEEGEEPDVTLVWRAEVACLTDPANRLAARSLERAVEAMRLSPRERLRLPISVARDALTRLTRRLKGDTEASRILLSAPRQSPEVRVAALGDLDWKRDLPPGATLYLPLQAGGLGRDGHLDPAAAPLEAGRLDVADPDGPEERAVADLSELRVLVDAAGVIVGVLSPQSAEKTKAIKGKPLKDATTGLRPLLRVPLKPRGEGVSDGEDESSPQALVYLAQPPDAVQESSSISQVPVPLDTHCKAVGERARAFATRLGLPETLCDALALAGEWHDEGKARPVWQRAVGNTDLDPARAWAKSGGTERTETLGGFRHELASLLKAEDDGTLADHPERDLILHLIATHHGRGRPWFDSDAYEKGGDMSLSRHEESDAAQALRFHRLQRRFGPWGLAWLEAVLRAADWSVSREQSGKGAP